MSYSNLLTNDIVHYLLFDTNMRGTYSVKQTGLQY